MTLRTLHRVASVLIALCSTMILFLIGTTAVIPFLVALCVFMAVMITIEFVLRHRERQGSAAEHTSA